MTDHPEPPIHFVGIDVQIRRGVPVVVMDSTGSVIRSLWLEPDVASVDLSRLIEELGPRQCVLGIDAPRRPLPSLRRWSCRQKRWRREQGIIGRHCEVAIRALGIGNPQWTPLPQDAPDWMVLGFDLFAVAEATGAKVHEVFPTVTYRQLNHAEDVPPVTWPLTGMSRGPKDMLDAVAAAYTVWRYDAGDGVELGGGDGLGTIVVPGTVDDHPVLQWPE